jgi:pimeloyl-ACP methyl ester carboxylesterase
MNPLVLSDGRTLELRVSGPEDGLPLVFHHGVPGTLPSRGFERAVHKRGLRLVAFSRPGYGGSTRLPGRAVVDVVADTAAVLRSIGTDRFLVAGWSGGGPHALACAARLPGAIRALVIAGIGPTDGEGLDFPAGMNQDNVDEWNAVFRGEAHLRAYIEQVGPELMVVQPGDVVTDIGLPAADAAVMTGEFGDDLAKANRDGLRFGFDGWVDDELAFARPWGFDLAGIDVPVSFWHGRDDMNVPFTHGRWVAAHVPNASLHLEDGEGHMSIMTRPVDRMLDELTAAG